jgi:hypothetical protein
MNLGMHPDAAGEKILMNFPFRPSINNDFLLAERFFADIQARLPVSPCGTKT